MNIEEYLKNLGDKKVIIKIDEVPIYEGNSYAEFYKALNYVYLKDFIAEIIKCKIIVNIGKFVWQNNQHTIKCVER